MNKKSASGTKTEESTADTDPQAMLKPLESINLSGAGHEVRQAIKLNLPKLSSAEKELAAFTISRYQECAMMSIVELSEACDVSPSTVNRYTRTLGYSGYREYLAALRSEQTARPSYEQLMVGMREGSVEQLVHVSLKEDETLIQLIQKSLDIEQYVKGVEALIKSRRVFLYGQGSSTFMAGYFAFNLQGLGIDAIDLSDASGPEGVGRTALQMGKDDTLISIAFPRFSAHTLDISRFAAERGCTNILISSSLKGELASNADLIFFTPSRQDFHSGCVVPAMATIEALLTAISNHHPEAADTARSLSPLIDKHLLDDTN